MGLEASLHGLCCLLPFFKSVRDSFLCSGFWKENDSGNRPVRHSVSSCMSSEIIVEAHSGDPAHRDQTKGVQLLAEDF